VTAAGARNAAALTRHVKAALLHLRQAGDIAERTGIDVDGGTTPRADPLCRRETTEDLDLWVIGNARARSADRRARPMCIPSGDAARRAAACRTIPGPSPAVLRLTSWLGGDWWSPGR
jgi:hypothetical protein